MTIKEHFDILLKKYNLKNQYIKFIVLSIFCSLIIRGFYWVLIIFAEIIKNNSKLIKYFALILIFMFSLKIPLEKLLKDISSDFIKKVRLANTLYFNDRVKHMNKNELLNFNLLEYNVMLNNFNDNLEQYILNGKNEFEIPFYYVTLIVIALNKRSGLIIVLFAIFYIAIKTFNELRLIDEEPIIKETIEHDNNVRNYIANSKILLINNELNSEYLIENINKLEETKFTMHKINNKLNYSSNIAMIIFMIILIYSKVNDLNQYDFFYYFLIVYDVEFISDKMAEFYKNKVVNKIEERLKYLEKISYEPNNITNSDLINKIIISELKHDKPKISITNTLIIEGHILINGISGSGKTSLLFILKGIIVPNILKIEPAINNISSQTFISIPGTKGFYSDYLYNIISNYEKKPDIDLIDYAIKFSKMGHIFNQNEKINVERLSSGERVRLYISQIIYTVIKRKYNILLFDELDENLNDDVAQEICINIREIFKDKIILYISHNQNIIKLFDKRLVVIDGVISNIEFIHQ
jgi:ABC-type lipoprotein export system ATPase subunit